MYTIKFQAHNSSARRQVNALDVESVYQIACALNFTGFSFVVYSRSTDITEAIESRMRADLSLPVSCVTGFKPIVVLT